jgi:hypothetical protein
VQPDSEQLAFEMQNVQLALEIREERQAASVADVVSALIAVTRPIIVGVLYSIGAEYLSAYEGDRGSVPLKMLGRLEPRSLQRLEQKARGLDEVHACLVG